MYKALFLKNIEGRENMNDLLRQKPSKVNNFNRIMSFSMPYYTKKNNKLKEKTFPTGSVRPSGRKSIGHVCSSREDGNKA